MPEGCLDLLSKIWPVAERMGEKHLGSGWGHDGYTISFTTERFGGDEETVVVTGANKVYRYRARRFLGVEYGREIGEDLIPDFRLTMQKRQGGDLNSFQLEEPEKPVVLPEPGCLFLPDLPKIAPLRDREKTEIELGRIWSMVKDFREVLTERSVED